MTGFLLLVLAGCGGGGGGETSAALSPPAGDEAGNSAGAAKTDSAVVKQVIDSTLIPEPGVEPVREEFNYSGGARDPFASLLDGRSIGPELKDLDVVGVVYVEQDPKSSTVVLRDRVSGKQYSAREGERVGRARVSTIGARAVTFTVDDFGTQREVTLAMRKREDVP